MFDLACLLLALPLQTAAQQDPPVHPSRLLVKTVAGTADDARLASLSRAGAHELVHLPQIGWSVVEVPPHGLADARLTLQRDGHFSQVRFDRARRLAHTPNDPMYAGQWHLPQIGADLAWDTIKGSPTVQIAIMDTGIEVSHQDLSPNVWTNPGEIAGNGIDDDGNGYVDDVNGYDFAYGDPDPDDQHGHGTSCAGIAAAVQDNAEGVSGVAPQCQVVAIKTALDTGYFYDSAVVPALVYCADMGFEVISMSFYSDDVTPAEKDAMDYCWANGVLPVAAAGNSDSTIPYYPGAYEPVLAVGATESSLDDRAWFSNFGTWVDVAAPGWNLSTSSIGASYTTSFGGTSGACPHVAGLAGLLFAANPAATNAGVRTAIEDTALLLDEAPFGKWTSYGRIDAKAAVDRVLGLTSGSVPPRSLFVAPCGGGPGKVKQVSGFGHNRGPDRMTVAFHGVGLEPPNVVTVRSDGRPARILSQDRNLVVARLPLSRGISTVEVDVDGTEIDCIIWDIRDGCRIYGASDGNTDTQAGGTPVATGGFHELYRDDGSYFTCTPNDSDEIYAEFSVRGLPTGGLEEMVLELTRSYSDCAGGVETIEVYDWSTNSYPYGSWVTVATHVVGANGFQALELPLPGDPNRYADDLGTVYVRVTTTNAGSAGLMEADRVRLVVR